MNNLYNKIYEAIDNGIQKALIIKNDQTEDSSVIFHHKKISSEYIQYELQMVDLELPSGLLWSEYNIGAYPGSKPEDWYGNYYAFGETVPKKMYSQYNYKFDKKMKELLQYSNNHILTLGTENDAAYACNSLLRMPTKKEFQELIDYTYQEWVENYNNITGLNGILFKRFGKQIFLPAAGFYLDPALSGAGTAGVLWSSSFGDDYQYNYAETAYGLFYKMPDAFNKTIVNIGDYKGCYYGYPVRAVSDSIS